MSNYQANIITKSPATPTGPAQNGSAPGMWRMDEAAYWVKQGVWPTQGIIPGDTYFRYVTMLLSTTSLGNANNSLFVDSSGAFNPISRNGNTTQGSATPYSANWSNYFNGTNSRMSISDNAAFGFGTGNFTVEFWLYYTGGNGYKFFFVNNSGSGNYVGYGLNNGTLTPWVWNNGNVLVASSNITPNTWQHHALVRNGSTLTIYLNGTSIGSTTWATDIGSSRPFYIGWNGGGDTQSPPGYFSNFRVVKGTAVYTGNFTPPTSALTAISGTSLLTCQSNRFRDASTNNFTVTVSGGINTTDFSPFAPAYPGITYNQSDITNWSGYFDGSGDYLTVPSNAAFDFGTGDFTIEGWIWLASTASVVTIVTNYAGPSAGWSLQYRSDIGGFRFGWGDPALLDYVASIPTNTWMHLAVTRSGTSLRMFLNGTQVASTTNSTSLTGGSTVSVGALNAGGYVQNYNGYISNLRIVKGTAVYTSGFTPSTTNLTAISGTSLLTLQNAAFTDNSTNNFVITPNGNVTVTGNSPFNTVGYWSNYFDGSGDYLTVPTSAAFEFGTGDFTIEGWLYYQPTGALQLFADWRPPTTDGVYPLLYIDTSGNVIYHVSGAARITSSSVAANTWNHFAVSRSGTSTRLFINGTQAGSTYSDSNNYLAGSSRPVIGASGYNIGTLPFKGYLSNLRLVKGTAVYTSNFTVPTTPLTAITNTSLLTCQASRIIDSSTNAFTITRNGDVSVQSFDPFYTSTIASNGGSMYFDGSGDYLTSPSSPNYALGTGDFIVEVWVNPSVQGGHGSSNNDCIIDFRPGSNGAYGTLYSFNSGASINWVVSGAIRITGGAIPNNAWSHLMVSRVSGSTRLFINGVQSGSTYSDSTDYLQAPVWLGQFNDGPGAGWFQGYMSGARIVKGTGVSSTFTPPTAPQTPTAATTLLINGMNAGLFDATAINDMETVSGAQVATNISKFGGSSAFFNGTGGFLDIPAASSKDSAFGTGDFTVEMWLYFNSVSGSPTIITFNNFGSGDGFFLNVESSAIGVRADGSTPIRASTTVTTGVWYHVAVTRSSGTLRLFQDGVNVGSTTWTTNCTAGLLRIGQPKDTTGATYALSGYMDDLRVTKGYARYTSNFTPPTQAFPTY